jgi:hypothetical protein
MVLVLWFSAMSKRRTIIGLALIIFLASCRYHRMPELQQQPVSPLVVSVLNHRLYIPVVQNGPGSITPPMICEHNQVAHELAQLFLNDPGQQRKQMICHPTLVLVAQRHADDMFDRQYFGHCNLDGLCPNKRATNTGYPLPQSYAENGNNIESLAVNQKNADDAWAALLDSPSHRVHVLGEIEFFREQECYGIGYTDKMVRSVPWPIDKAYVIITASCP